MLLQVMYILISTAALWVGGASSLVNHHHGPTTPAPYHPYSPAPYGPTPSYHHPKKYCDARIAPYCANATGLHYCLEGMFTVFGLFHFILPAVTTPLSMMIAKNSRRPHWVVISAFTDSDPN